MSPKQHCILLAHGSRDKHWCETFTQGLGSIEQLLNKPASLAFMEMASPSLEQVIEREYAAGTRHFSITPLFLAAGRHLLVDVPQQLEELKTQFGGSSFSLHQPLGQESDFWLFIAKFINRQNER